jgi:hypothetical protein
LYDFSCEARTIPRYGTKAVTSEHPERGLIKHPSDQFAKPADLKNDIAMQAATRSSKRKEVRQVAKPTRRRLIFLSDCFRDAQ